jgi:hypothetical protein
MDDTLKQQIKQYLIENLTFGLTTRSDIYGINNDENTITLYLEGEPVTTVILDAWN